jgi:hypothetical protein
MPYVNKITALWTALMFSIWSFTLQAQTVEMQVSGNKALANIALPGGIAADISLTFENVVGLSSTGLGVRADLIDLTDMDLIERLPGGLLKRVTLALPMMITIEPPAEQGLSFEGLVTFDIHTHNLEYTSNTPLRLYKAQLGGQFRDITMTTGAGSYRARGTTGKFSQFIIVADLRPTQSVMNAKWRDLQDELIEAMPVIQPSVYTVLNGKLEEIAREVNSRQYLPASQKLNEFIQLIEASSGDDIPNVWRSSRDVNNVAGELMAQANSLRYTLHLLK